jgi:hypothetical protein
MLRHLWLRFGWSALLIIFLIPMSDVLRGSVVFCLFLALGFFDLFLTVRESPKKVDPDPKK